MEKWYSKKMTVALIFSAITILALYSAKNLKVDSDQNSMQNVYEIRFEYFGMDAAQIEKIVTVPLEEKLRKIHGVSEIKSTCSQNQSSTYVCFFNNVSKKEAYIQVSETADSIHDMLPDDVQKPAVYFSSEDIKPTMCIAFFQSDDKSIEIEKNLKVQIQKLKDVSEVTISGQTQKDICINFLPGKNAFYFNFPWDIGQTVSGWNKNGGFINFLQDGIPKRLHLDRYLSTVADFNGITINYGNKRKSLDSVAETFFSVRKKNEIVKINGKECFCLNIKTGTNCNGIKASSQIRKILERFSNVNGISYEIIYDKGKEQEEMFVQLLEGLLSALVFSIIVSALFFRNLNVIIALAVQTSVSIIWTAGLLSILDIPLTKTSLSGIIISIGMISDTILVIAELREQNKSDTDFFTSMNVKIPAVFTSAVTNVIAFIPLCFLDFAVPGIKNFAFTAGILIITATAISVLIIPPFLSYKHNLPEKYEIRLAYICQVFTKKHGKILLKLFPLILMFPVVFLCLMDKNISDIHESSVIYASVEYHPQQKYEYIEKDITRFIEKASAIKGIKYIKSHSQTGSCNLEIVIEKKAELSEIAENIRKAGKTIGTGFLYMPLVKDSKNIIQKIQIAVIGKESTKCREAAEKACRNLNQKKYVNQAILNFKENEKQYVVLPSKERLSMNSLSSLQFASYLRWCNFGPVTGKWISDGNEYDIRVSAQKSGSMTLQDILNLHIPVKENSFPIFSVAEKVENEVPGKIFRKNHSNAAYFTVESDVRNTFRLIKDIKECLSEIDLPDGYTFSFPKSIQDSKHHFLTATVAFTFALLLIFLFIAGNNENPRISLLITSSILFSISLPLFLNIITSRPLETADIIAMIFVSGNCINNSIYIVDSKKEGTRKKIRSVIKSISSTSLTTCISSIPMLAVRNSYFSNKLGFFMLTGTIASFVFSICIFPLISMQKDKKATLK